MIIYTELIAEYLRTLPAIRERCQRVFDLATQGKLQYLDYHPEKEADVAAFCVHIITRDFGSDFTSIPPHGRWRHLDAGRPRVDPLIAKWRRGLGDPQNDREICKRLIDLFLVSVLLDAGAGNAWVYHEPNTDPPVSYSRSEGLGVASINMFEKGFFSSDPAQPYMVNADGLSRITVEQVARAMQVSEYNPMVGLEGRTSLLSNLASALRTNTVFFGHDARPGNIIDFLEAESQRDGDGRRVPVAALWHALIEGLNSIWPASRTTLLGVSLGDVWPCPALAATATDPNSPAGHDLVPFHKLTGWITYSLIEPIERILGWRFVGTEDMVGLPEYRNGGLLIDFGVLTIKPGVLPIHPTSGIPCVPPSHPAIVEWRAMTVIELDRIADAVRKLLGLSATQLTLAQVLESATWKGGREIAKQKRPETGGPPIDIESDGTVF